MKLFFKVKHSNRFSFLDIKKCCDNQNFHNTICRKATFRWVFTNFSSYQKMTANLNKKTFTIIQSED